MVEGDGFGMIDFLKRHLIRIDGTAGLCVGIPVLLLADRLASLFGVPVWLIVVNGMANLAYGTFSTTLASFPSRSIYLVSALSIANMVWAIICFTVGLNLVSTASFLAVGNAFFEGLFVGSLGVLEWRWRHQLVLPVKAPI